MSENTYSLLFICFLFTFSAAAQQGNAVGEVHTVRSEILNETYTIQVYVPKSYGTTERKHPTLYILDGQWFFLNGVAIQETLRGDVFLPEMIIVGVVMNRPGRDQTYDQRWNEFSQFIESELVQFIDQNYRSSDDRILFGWETSSFLACELLLKADGVFSGAIATNGGNISESMMDQYSQLNLKTPRYLYLSNTSKDIYTLSYTQKTVSILEDRSMPHLTWEYRQVDDEVHESLPYLSLYQGLKFYYHNYSSPVYSSIQEFNNMGGLDALENYFRVRGERFGLPTKIDDATKNTLIWMAWKENNFETFKLFMDEFSDVLSTSRYSSAYWQNRLGQFYLKYNHADEAIPFFERGISQYPDEEFMVEMYGGLGDAYLKKDDKRRAKHNYQFAIQYAKKNSDERLSYYQDQLKKLK